MVKNEGLVSETDAKDATNKIRDRVKVVKHDTTRRYNFWALAILLLVPLLPIAYAWLSPLAFSNAISTPWHGKQWIIGFFMLGSSAIYIGILGYFFYSLFEVKKSWWPIKKLAPEVRQKRISGLVSVFARETEEETTTQNIRESDPTTIEFHSIFRDLLGKAQKGGRRIVLVLDNIDRLPKSNVPLVWSEVRSLFANNGARDSVSDAWVTVIVPYDKPFIEQAFQTEDNNSGDSNAVDIINKTFDRTLRVSPPVSTDWRRFMQVNLDKAYEPKLDDATAFRLFKLLDYSFQQNSISPTPRRIVNFINEVGVYLAPWSEKISIEAIALYVLHRDEVEGNPSAIRKATTVDKRFIQLSGVSDWQQAFAALEFNVDPLHGQYLLLDQPIRKALAHSDASLLKDCSTVNGFNEVLQDVLFDCCSNWMSTGGEEIANLVHNMASIELSGELKRNIWVELTALIANIEYIGIEDETPLRHLSSILEFNELDGRLKAIHELGALVTRSENHLNEDSFKGGKYWAARIAFLKSHAVSISPDAGKTFIEKLQMSEEIEFLRGVALACVDIEDIQFIDFRTPTSKNDLVESLTNDIDDIPMRFVHSLPQLAHLISEDTLTECLETTANQLRANQSVLSNSLYYVEAFYWLYQKIKDTSVKKAQLVSLVEDGTLLFLAHSWEDTEQEKAIAQLIWLIVANQGGDSLPTIPDNHSALGPLTEARDWYASFFETEPAEVFVSELAACIETGMNFSSWLEHSLEIETGGEFFEVVMRHSINEGKYNNLNITKVIENYTTIKDTFGDETTAKLLKNFGGWHSYFNKYLNETLIHKVSNELLSDIAQVPPDNKIHGIPTIIDQHLKKLNDVQWEKALDSEDDNLRLLIARHKHGSVKIPVQHYRPTVLAHVKNVLTGNVKSVKYLADWEAVISAIPTQSQKALIDDVSKSLPNLVLTQDGVDHFIDIYNSIADRLDLYTQPDYAMEHFFSNVVFGHTEAATTYIDNKTDLMRRCYKKANQSAAQAFVQALQSLTQDSNESRKNRAVQLASKLKINLEIETEIPEEDTE